MCYATFVFDVTAAVKKVVGRSHAKGIGVEANSSFSQVNLNSLFQA